MSCVELKNDLSRKKLFTQDLMKTFIKKKLLRLRPQVLRFKHLFGLSTSVDELEVVINFLSKHLTSTSDIHCIDIGFHHGESSEKFLKLFAGVLAFEPSAKAISRASKKIVRDPRLDLRNQAISNKPGLTQLYLSETSTGISSLLSSGALHNSSIKIEAVTLNQALDSYRERDLSKISCIKIDVEGLECEILGQISAIAKLRPMILLSEFQDLKSTHGDLKEQLCKGFGMGYKCIISAWKPVLQYGCAHEWERFIPIDSPESVDIICSYLYSSWGNLIFVRPNMYELLLNDLSEYELAKKT